MKREIKYQAYCQDTEVMWDWEQVQKIDRWWNHGSLIPLQFIGIKDKKGIEVYEGNILKDNVGRIWLIKFNEKEGSFNFYYNGGKCNQPFKRFIKTQLPLEIIGTVFKNPELLYH